MNQEKIGKFISKLRKDKKLTQEQFSEKMGVSTNAVSKWERGISFPDVSLLKKICNELDISIEELINGEKNNSEEAKEKAVFNVIESRNKTKKKLKTIITISLLFILTLIVLSTLLYKNKEKEIDNFYEKNYQMSFVARNIEAFLKYRYDGKYPDYYGGMYISNDANNVIVEIVKEKLPVKGTREFYYYNELFTVDKSIKIEYVKNSYNDLSDTYNKINDYLLTNEPIKELNSVSIDVYKNRVVVDFVELTEEIKNNFKEKIIDSDLVMFTTGSKLSIKNKCTNSYNKLASDILKEHGNLLMSINVGNKSYVPISLSLYDDGTYELFTAYESCMPNRNCNMILKYTKSIKGNYNYDLEKILNESKNANNLSFDMDNLPEYEITLGESLINKYNTLSFVVEKNKNNKYLDELLNIIDIDLNKCANVEYVNE